MWKIESLNRLEAALDDAVERCDLATIESIFERYARLLLEAVTEARSEEIGRIEKTLGRAYATLVLKHGASAERTVSSVACALAAGSRMATVARRMVPHSGDRTGTAGS